MGLIFLSAMATDIALQVTGASGAAVALGTALLAMTLRQGHGVPRLSLRAKQQLRTRKEVALPGLVAQPSSRTLL